MKKERLNCEKARTISIVKTLEKLGYFPIKKSEKEAWFLSPFRSETQASFKVSLKLNRWYDHGEGKGGNILDLIIQLKNYTISEALSFLGNDINLFSFHKQAKILIPEEKGYEIVNVKVLEHKALLDYLKSRKIDLETAKSYCKEIHYRLGEKTFFAIAFENISKGHETRNKYFKGCLGKKDITVIENGGDDVFVFEGFLDFLSYLTLFPNRNLKEDYIILNSVSLIEKITKCIQKYDIVYAFLDNDKPGKSALKLLKTNKQNVINGSLLYSGYNDLNEYLMNEELAKVTE